MTSASMSVGHRGRRARRRGEARKRPITVVVAIVANLVIAVAKFIAGASSGSSAMIAEGIHSVIDTGNEGLLLVGEARSRRPPDEGHPFGYGKELYFWSLIVAVLLFGVGGGMSFYEGVHRLVVPEERGEHVGAYVVLAVAAVAEGSSWLIAVRAVKRHDRGHTFWDKLHHSKDPAKFVVVGEDTAALAGLAVAFAGVLTSQLTGSVLPDAIASMIIGLLLGAVAVYLAIESKHLLLGEAMDVETVGVVRRAIEAHPSVERAGRPLTMHLGPKQVLLNVDIAFGAGISSSELARAIDEIEARVRSIAPDVRRIFIEPQLSSEAP
jgi:cation diffusion facilitator family transporter